MASLVRRGRAFRHTPHFKRLWKFGSVSIISTCVAQVVLFLTYHTWAIGTAMECNVIATAVASVPAYYLNRSWTWGKKGRSDLWREVIPFWAISLFGLVVSTIMVGIAAHNADRFPPGSLGKALVINFANLFTYGCIWTGRYFVFNRYLFGDATRNARSIPADEPGQLAVAADPQPATDGETGPGAIAVPVIDESAEFEVEGSQVAGREAADQPF